MNKKYKNAQFIHKNVYIEYEIAWGRNKCSEIKQIHILQKRAIRLR